MAKAVLGRCNVPPTVLAEGTVVDSVTTLLSPPSVIAGKTGVSMRMSGAIK